MNVPNPRIPYRFESVERMAVGNDLKSLIVPVDAGLRRFDEISHDMGASMSGAFLILRADPGSGKTTLLHTLSLFRKDVQAVSIERDEPIRAALNALPPFAGAIRVVVIESREARGDTSDEEIEASMMGINAFIRSDAGMRTVVVWPCNAEEMQSKLVASAAAVGGDALLGVGEPVFRYSGPERGQFLQIARQTIASFNNGASLGDLGISEGRAEQLVRHAPTIGAFLRSLQVEERNNRQQLASRLEAHEQCHMWVVVVAGNDPEAEIGVLTRGSLATADIERLMGATDANVVTELNEHPEKLGLLAAAFDAKILHLPALTAIEVAREFAAPAMLDALKKHGFHVAAPTDARGRLVESDLAAALSSLPVHSPRRGRKPEAGRLAPFEAIAKLAQANDVALNRMLGDALVACGLIEAFDVEADLGGGLERRSDLICDRNIDPIRLEIMWRSATSRAEIANYVLTKLYNYGRAIRFF